jgi:4-amino-4-deoxy-L-arabinose transferase-like glycosyltransferase
VTLHPAFAFAWWLVDDQVQAFAWRRSQSPAVGEPAIIAVVPRLRIGAALHPTMTGADRGILSRWRRREMKSVSVKTGPQILAFPRSLAGIFVALWAVLQILKLWIASGLPLHVDEAFYSWEGQHLAWAYSDLPGMTAWLARLGTQVGGQEPLALRSVFLVLGAAVPWLVVRISRRWFGPEAGWQAGLLALLMPLSGMLGVMAVPDVVIALAALLCVDALARLREQFSWMALGSLALGLAAGALSHYRFALVVVAGALGILADPRSRRLFGGWRPWLAVLAGLMAWIPLLAWNLDHGEAGVRFQFVDRHPWHFDAGGIVWLAIQALLVSPVLFVLLLSTLRYAWRHGTARSDGPWRLLGTIGALAVLGYFFLGFFVDRQRVSFHWPLAGWLVLMTAAPVVLAAWNRTARIALYLTAALGLSAGLSFMIAARSAPVRDALASTRLYPADFAGWSELAQASRNWRGTIVASDFATASQLAFALDRPDILVLDTPLNHKHGRAAQLALWNLTYLPGQVPAATLVWNDTGIALKNRLAAYRGLCRDFGALPAPRILDLDRGRRRYLVYSLVASKQPVSFRRSRRWTVPHPTRPWPGAST